MTEVAWSGCVFGMRLLTKAASRSKARAHVIRSAQDAGYEFSWTQKFTLRRDPEQDDFAMPPDIRCVTHPKEQT